MPGRFSAMEQKQFGKQHVVDLLRRMQHPDIADEAERELPDPIDADRLVEWMAQRGLTHDSLISQMGGSP
jgi:hypothetical protein